MVVCIGLIGSKVYVTKDGEYYIYFIYVILQLQISLLALKFRDYDRF